MITDKGFCEELGNVPELPPGLFGKIDKKIRRRSVFVRTAVALAATVIIAVGTTGVLIVQREGAQACPPEVAAELQSVKSYLAGDDLELVNTSYVLYENEPAEQ